MNQIKLNRIRREIMMADQICFEIDLNSILEKINHINKIDITEDEKNKIINRYGEQLSLACEHYLKAMIIPRMHFEGIDNEGEDELNKIFDNRDSQGLARKYSHYFDKLLTSDNTALIISDGLQVAILKRLAERLKITELHNYNSELLNSWLNDDLNDSRFELSKENMLNKIKEEINKNKSAYPDSRYAMFTDYEADVEFLVNLCLTLQEFQTKTLNNCLFVPGINRHIFPDDECEIVEKRTDGSLIIFKYHFGNKKEIMECNGTKKEDLGQYQQFNDLFPNITRDTRVEEVSYVENGDSVIVKYNKFLNSFVQIKNPILEKEINKAK